MKPLWYVTLQRKTWHISEVKFKPIYQILVLVESSICICTSLLCIDFKLIYQLYLEITNVYMLINLILEFLFQQTHESCVNSCPAVIIHTKDNYTCHVSTDLSYLRCLLTDKRHKHSRLTQHFSK